MHPLHAFSHSLLRVLAVLLLAATLANPGSAAADQPLSGPTPVPGATIVPETLRLGADLAIQAGSAPKHPKMDAAVYQVALDAQAGRLLPETAGDAPGIRMDGESLQVQIATSADRAAAARQAVLSAGGQVTGLAFEDTVLQAWVPVSMLSALTDSPAVDRVRLPEYLQALEVLSAGTYTSEGVAAMNASAWHAAGILGTGVRIGIIDLGFLNYASLLGSELPSTVATANFVDGQTPAQANGTTVHGTACAEVIHDVAPGASLYLAKIATTVDISQAVQWLRGQQVDIISSSIGTYVSGPGDGTGALADLVASARQTGILWVTSAGNERLSHWGGDWAYGDGDSLLDFSPGVEVNAIVNRSGDLIAISAGADVSAYLRWDDWTAVNQDYDLYVVRGNLATGQWEPVDPSGPYCDGGIDLQDGGPGQRPIEYVQFTTYGDAAPYGFVVDRYQATRDVHMEFYCPDCPRIDPHVAERSLVQPADSAAALTAAAVDAAAPYAQEVYSSEGPTNGAGGGATGGIPKPDIAAYANVSSAAYGLRSAGKSFNGTSAAAPHVAGAAALVLSAYPYYTPDQIQTALQSAAIDQGTPGRDNAYGYGRLYLGTSPTLPATSTPASPTPTPSRTPGTPPAPTRTPVGRSQLYVPAVRK